MTREQDERDLSILALFEAGYSQKQIADQLRISRRAVIGVIDRDKRASLTSRCALALDYGALIMNDAPDPDLSPAALEPGDGE